MAKMFVVNGAEDAVVDQYLSSATENIYVRICLWTPKTDG